MLPNTQQRRCHEQLHPNQTSPNVVPTARGPASGQLSKRMHLNWQKQTTEKGCQKRKLREGELPSPPEPPTIDKRARLPPRANDIAPHRTASVSPPPLHTCHRTSPHESNIAAP